MIQSAIRALRGIATTILVVSCLIEGGIDTLATQVQHPDEASVIRPDLPVQTVDSELVPVDSRFRRVANRLDSYEVVASIGVFDAPAAEVFGKIQDVALSPNGHVYVLDSQANEVRVFDRTGALVRRGGREGSGPGEFINPISVAVGENGLVYVGEIQHTIEVLEPSGAEFTFVRQIRLDVAAQDLCALEDGLLVHGHHVQTNRILHRYSFDGELQTRFGQVYRPDPMIIAHQISVGQITCPDRGEVVAFVPSSQLADVRGYKIDGTARWVSLLPDYRPTIIEVTASGYSVRLPEDGWHRLFSATVAVPSYLLVQIGYITPEDNAAGMPYTLIESYLFDVATGEGGYVGHALPPIVAADKRCYVTARATPFPQLEIHCRRDEAVKLEGMSAVRQRRLGTADIGTHVR